LQYGELLRASALSAAQLRHALLVLIQHNCVNCFLKEEPPTMRGPGPSYFLYEAALPNILQILR
jgi:DNA-directed RNA polymerase III subunit RPC3